MDIKHFFKLLKQYKWILIIVPIISLAATYFKVKDLPKKYISTAQISTGLIDQSQQIVDEDKNQDYFKVNSQFENIIELLKMDKMTSILSYDLILHDLQNTTNSLTKISGDIQRLSTADRVTVINSYKELLSTKTIITPALNSKFKLYDIIRSMGYDKTALYKNLNIKHADNSDFITIEYTSDNPNLSAFTVNTLANEFISNYTVDVSNNQYKSNIVLDSLVRQKEKIMNAKNDALKNYKVSHNVLNLDKESEDIYAQLSDREQKKSDALKDIQTNANSIASINSRLNSKDPVYSNSNAIAENGKIINLRNQLTVANEHYVDNNFRPADKKKVDSLQEMISTQLSLNSSSDHSVPDQGLNKQALLTEKANAEIALQSAKDNVKSTDLEIAQLQAKYNTMVPFDAGIQNLQTDADAATKEYLELLNKTNENDLQKNIGLKLHIAEEGFPGAAEPSKKVLYMALAGISSFSICFISILIIFLLDRTINTVQQLRKVTGKPVLGHIGLVKNNNRDIKTMWNDENSQDPEYAAYRDLLRSLRFEIDQILTLDGSKVLGITSLHPGDGKTFLASSLIYAFAMMNKKVLLISSENTTEPDQKLIPQLFESFIIKKQIQTEDLITIVNSKSNKSSLFEIQNKENLQNGFNILKTEFDIIIIDISSLEMMNQAKEWLVFADKSIAVFEAGQTVSDNVQENVNYLTDHPGFIGWVLNKQVEK